MQSPDIRNPNTRNIVDCYWPGTDPAINTYRMRSHTPLCWTNHDIALRPARKTNTNFTREESDRDPPVHAMRRRCTTHTQEFDRNESAAFFVDYGVRGSVRISRR